MEGHMNVRYVIPTFLPPFLDDETKNQKIVVDHQENDVHRVRVSSRVQVMTVVPCHSANNDPLGPCYLKTQTELLLYI